jgi:hypothetical protein
MPCSFFVKYKKSNRNGEECKEGKTKEASPMNRYGKKVKRKLTTLIEKMSTNLFGFVKNPGKDFTRKRKLPFAEVVKLLISMGGNSIYKELLEAQGYELNTATTSAFIQQREKILPRAFEHLLHEFTKSHDNIQKYRGYRLLASDGSDLNISANPDDVDTYYQNKEGGKGFNMLHLNVLYDLCNRLYVDTVIQPSRIQNEKKALTDMVDRSIIGGKTIVIADRNFESYNIFAHIEQKGWNYLIRVKDINSNGILSALSLPDEDEFDVSVSRLLTRKQTNHVKANPDIYRFLPSTTNFDFLERKSDAVYHISFRVVRLEIGEGSYQTIITNLDRAEFSPNEIKQLYKMRWGVETSFRELKYAVGLVNFHAKKREYITQEIFARIIMYNFAEMITSHVVISHADKKHTYQVNFTLAIHFCRFFLRLRHNLPPPDIEALIRKNILPVRDRKSRPRIIRSKSVVSFNYRVA